MLFNFLKTLQRIKLNYISLYLIVYILNILIFTLNTFLVLNIYKLYINTFIFIVINSLYE